MLKVKNLSCGYEKEFVLKEINFKIKHGEFIGIIGPNGSGKTTLLKAITRVLKFKQGEIILEGKNIAKMGFKELAREVAVVSQDCRVGIMTVEEFVLLGRIPYYGKFQFLETGKDKEIAEKYMTLTDTFKLKDKLMTRISEGEKQLVFIARALAQKPKLLLLDEPTAHLDITHQVAVLDLIRKLTRKLGLTAIMVLHNLNLASEYSDRLIMINSGKIRKAGTPQEVLTYLLIEEVYKTVVVVKKNPFSLKPHILIVSEEERKKKYSP
ncbi:ABC transporter ATP-binding protein [bacterium]|nr:ABC transporter ATP-binding protein [bacterium]